MTDFTMSPADSLHTPEIIPPVALPLAPVPPYDSDSDGREEPTQRTYTAKFGRVAILRAGVAIAVPGVRVVADLQTARANTVVARLGDACGPLPAM